VEEWGIVMENVGWEVGMTEAMVEEEEEGKYNEKLKTKDL
jgi:hypothetical protein